MSYSDAKHNLAILKERINFVSKPTINNDTKGTYNDILSFQTALIVTIQSSYYLMDDFAREQSPHNDVNIAWVYLNYKGHKAQLI